MSDQTSTAVAERLPLTATRFVSIFGIGVVGFMVANLIPLMLVAMTSELGMTVSTAGAVMTGSMLATAITSMLTARYAALSGRHLIGRAGLVLMIVGFGLAAIVPSAAVAVVGIIVGGIGGGGAVSSSGAAIAAIRDPNRVNGWASLTNRIVVTVVLAIIPLLGGGMLTAFGSVALLALFFLFCVGWLPSAPIKAVAVESEISAKAPRPGNRRVTIAGFVLLVSFALWGVGEDSIWAMAGAMGNAQAGTTDADLGFILSASTAGGVIALIPLTWVGKRLGRALPLGILLVLGGSMKILASFTTDQTVYMAAIIAWNTIYVAAFTYIAATAAALDAQGRWSGPLNGVYLFGSAFAPVVGALVADTFGFHTFGIIFACFSFVLCFPLVFVARMSWNIEKREAALTAQSPSSASSPDSATTPVA
ncbi:MFS transporter [Saxibacter everestensis]|uniref:MFS transporter n=1 Tax=Saxibacter everestensis TaxID=2909229 RepID=A0ABY8QYW5_9MICO|nr:MFS transporter [Brevibacteriaceae bacterium ZFBP1038]